MADPDDPQPRRTSIAGDTDRLRIGDEGLPLAGTKFRLKRRIGGGGMGAVFIGEHVELRREVAIKLLAPQLAGDASAMERLRREARAMARIGNPHIVDVHDLGVSDDGQPYVAMRLVDGRDLARVVQDEGPLPPLRVAGLLDQIAGALEAVHALGIVHRDLKPENVMLERRGQADFVTLLDFGIAQGPTQEDDRLTGAGQVIGTPGYMAPEQALKRPIDGRADQYSLAVIVYELLSGQSPYERVTPLQLIAAQLMRAPRPLGEVVDPGRVPPALQDVVMRAMSREPEDRFPDIAAFAQAFRAAAEAPAAATAPTEGFPSAEIEKVAARRPAGLRWALVAGAVVLVAGAAWLVLRDTAPPETVVGSAGSAMPESAASSTATGRTIREAESPSIVTGLKAPESEASPTAAGAAAPETGASPTVVPAGTPPSAATPVVTFPVSTVGDAPPSAATPVVISPVSTVGDAPPRTVPPPASGPSAVPRGGAAARAPGSASAPLPPSVGATTRPPAAVASEPPAPTPAAVPVSVPPAAPATAPAPALAAPPVAQAAPPPAGPPRLEVAGIRTSGGIARNEVDWAVQRTLVAVAECAAGKLTLGDEAEVSVMIDADGFFDDLSATGAAALAGCAKTRMKSGRLRRRPDTGDVRVMVTLRAVAR